MSSLGDRAQQARRFIPLPVLLRIGRRRVADWWENEEYREAQIRDMNFLLGNTERAAEVPQIARDYAEFDLLRNYRRWRPRPLMHQRIEGLEWLTTKKDPNRGIVLNFMHHGQYDGLVGSFSNAGVYVRGVAAPEAFTGDMPVQLRQHFKLCASFPKAPLVNAGGGTPALLKVLQDNEILTIASDVAGRTPVTFLGREMVCSFGAARLAVEANAPVAILSSHQEPDGSPFFRVHEPIEPGDFADATALLEEIFRLHEPAVLAWPAAYDSPYGRLFVPHQKA